MGKSKKNFWKQMYLSNGWAIDKIVVTGVILFFIAIGFLANVILGIPEFIKINEGVSYYINLIGWYFASGFSTTALIALFCMFVYNVPYAAVSKTLAVARYCKTASFKRRADCCKKQQYFHRCQLLFCLYQKEVGILPRKKKSFPN